MAGFPYKLGLKIGKMGTWEGDIFVRMLNVMRNKTDADI